MPFVHITILSGRSPEYAQAVGDAINSSVIETMDFPENDRFQIIQEVPDHALQLQKRKGERLIMHLVMRTGRSHNQKQAFYQEVTRRLAESPGIPADNVVICFTENQDVDWSFGMGLASFLEGPPPFE